MQMQLPKIDVKRESLATILNEFRMGSWNTPRFQCQLQKNNRVQDEHLGQVVEHKKFMV